MTNPSLLMISIALGLPGAVLPRAQQPQSTSRLQRSDSLATITTDTGAFKPGNTEFSRYTTPTLCVIAANVAMGQLRRSMADQADEVVNDTTLGGHHVPAGVVTVARKCTERFTVAGVSPSELPDLFVVALIARLDSVASAVVARRVALSATTADRIHVLQEAIDGYLAATPDRYTTAESLVVQIDAMGPSVQDERLHAHQALLAFARTNFDELRMRAEAMQIITLANSVPAAAIHQVKPVTQAYAALAVLAYVGQKDAADSEAVTAVLTRAKHDLRQFSAAYKDATISTIREHFLPFSVSEYQGKPLPPMSATYWFPETPSVWPPGKGVPSLVFYGGEIADGCQRDEYDIRGANQAALDLNKCGVLYTYLPYWMHRYQNRLTVIVVAHATNNAAMSVPMPPAAVADSINWFFRTELHLPATVGVVADSVARVPAPDNRVTYIDTSFYSRLWGEPPAGTPAPLVVLLYGANHQLLYVGDHDHLEDDIPMLQRLLDRELGIKGVGK